MADLITAAYAKRRINQSSFSSDEDSLIDELIDACGNAIERHCARQFDSQSFDEIYSGQHSAVLQLRHYPVISLSRVTTCPQSVLTIQNTAASNQRATAVVTASGLTLTRTASGVSSTDTSITWAGNATLSDVVSAVNALGNGWSASVRSDYGDRASADLRAGQILDAKRAGEAFLLYTVDLSVLEMDTERGWLIAGEGTWPDCSYRILYTAGYATIPEAVQEACAVWVAELYWQSKRDPGLSALTAAGQSTQSWQTGEHIGIPRRVSQLLLPFIRYRV